MSEQKTYTIVSDDLCPIVGGDGAIICGKIAAFCGSEQTCTIPKDYFLGLLPLSERTLDKLFAKLQLLGYITYKAGGGRGRACVFGKGANLTPFIIEKRRNNCIEKAQNLQKKGAEIAPIKYNKNIVRLNAPTRETKQTNKKGNAGDTPAPPQVMNSYGQFWQAFFLGSYAQYEKTQEPYRQRAAAVWAHMSETGRMACLAEIRRGVRYDKTYYILHYLQNYKEPLPIWKNGDDDLTPQIVAQCIKVRYKGDLCYCLPKDLERVKAAGAVDFVPTTQP